MIESHWHGARVGERQEGWPVLAVHQRHSSDISDVIRLLRDKGEMAIVLVEQYFEFAYDLADRFVVLRRGEVMISGTKETLTKQDVLKGVSV